LNTIIGTYECKADNKGRLMIPAPLKKQLHEGVGTGFVLKKVGFPAVFRAVSYGRVGKDDE
jgi:MraZ protein